MSTSQQEMEAVVEHALESAARAGASEVVAIDQSAAAGEQLARNAELNGVADRVRFERANAMKDLRARAEAGERYDLVVVDPPAFARNRREAQGAGRGYKELNLRALQLVEPGGPEPAHPLEHARIVLGRDRGTGEGFGVGDHRAELAQHERTPAAANPLLTEHDPAPRPDADVNRRGADHEEDERREDQQHDEVEEALEPEPVDRHGVGAQRDERHARDLA